MAVCVAIDVMHVFCVLLHGQELAGSTNKRNTTDV